MEPVHNDKTLRVVEREGEPLAVVVHPDDFQLAAGVPKSRRLNQDLLSLAGVWSDLDAEATIDELYPARHVAPPSPHLVEG